MIFGLTPAELSWLAGATLAAGLIRGFTGFGTAMVYLPLAAQILSPIEAIVTLIAFDIFGPIPLLPRALRDADRGDLLRLLGGVALGLPFGLWILSQTEPETYRVAVSAVALVMVAALLLGVRYSRLLPPKAVIGVGSAGGLLGGFTGMPGPPVILTYLAGPHPATVTRAMTMLFLYGYDILVLGVLAIAGSLEWRVLLLGFCLAVPNLIGNIVGASAFRPGRENLYRYAAYGAISFAALSSLPVWD